MKLNHMAIITPHMKEAITFFRETMGLPVRSGDGYAEVDAGNVTLSLMPEYVVSLEKRPQGMVLQFEVTEVSTVTEQIRQRGGKILRFPEVYQWGIESAFVAGPDGLVIELYAWAKPQSE